MTMLVAFMNGHRYMFMPGVKGALMLGSVLLKQKLSFLQLLNTVFVASRDDKALHIVK